MPHSKKNATEEDWKKATERLSTTYIKSQLVTEADQATAKDILSKPPVDDKEVDNIVFRLHTTHTVSSSGETPRRRPPSSKVARDPATEEEIKVR